MEQNIGIGNHPYGIIAERFDIYCSWHIFKCFSKEQYIALQRNMYGMTSCKKLLTASFLYTCKPMIPKY